MKFNNKKILVVGFGRSGLSTARYLTGLGAEVTIGDIKPKAELDKNLLKEVRDFGVKLEAGEHRMATFLNSALTPFSMPVPEPSKRISMKMPQDTLNPVSRVRNLFL